MTTAEEVPSLTTVPPRVFRRMRATRTARLLHWGAFERLEPLGSRRLTPSTASGAR
jgi:hypothetical protein